MAALLSLRGTVCAKIIDLRPQHQKRFLPLEYRDPDEWQRSLSVAHAQAKRLVEKEIAEKPWTRQLLENQLLELEQISLFLDLVGRSRSPGKTQTAIVPYHCSKSVRKAIEKEYPEKPAWLLSLNLPLDWLEGLLFRHLKLIASLTKGAMTSRETGFCAAGLDRITTIVRGISEAEYAETDLQIDFSWWIRHRLLDPDTTVFVLPSAPSPAVQERLARSSVNWISERSLGSLLTRVEKLGTLFYAARATLATVSSVDPTNAVAAWAKYRSDIWRLILRKSSVIRFISSLSESWPESPELAAAREQRAKIINWNYAGSSFAYAKTIHPFQDLALWRSISSADEDWTWMKAHSDVIANRQLMTKPEFVEVGPTMCGDISWLERGPKEARKKFRMENDDSVYLAVFDIPLFVGEMRSRRGYGPYTLLATQEGLYAACVAALTDFPKLKLIIKRKRLQNPDYEFPGSLAHLLDSGSRWMQSGRVHLLDAKTDPYIPIVMADISLAAPFTSPVILSDMLGKPSFYYDETGFAAHSFQETFSKITYIQKNALLSAVGKAYEAALSGTDLERKYAETGARLMRSVHSNIRERLERT